MKESVLTSLNEDPYLSTIIFIGIVVSVFKIISYVFSS